MGGSFALTELVEAFFEGRGGDIYDKFRAFASNRRKAKTCGHDIGGSTSDKGGDFCQRAVLVDVFAEVCLDANALVESGADDRLVVLSAKIHRRAQSESGTAANLVGHRRGQGQRKLSYNCSSPAMTMRFWICEMILRLGIVNPPKITVAIGLKPLHRLIGLEETVSLLAVRVTKTESLIFECLSDLPVLDLLFPVSQLF